jgi:hypothetical protein
MLKMKRQPLDQNGFVPMLIAGLIVVLVVLFFVYTRVMHASH